MNLLQSVSSSDLVAARLERLGWLESRWEDINPVTEGRPKRRYYHLSQDGAERARHALATARTSISRLPGLRPGAAPSGGAA